MILLSFCAGFSGFFGRLFFSNKPYLRVGTAQYSGDAAIDRLRGLTDYQKVLVLICGYNNDENGAVSSYKTIVDNLWSRGIIDSNWVVIGVLWPDHTTAGFWMAEKSANDSGNRLRDVLKSMNPLELHVETHSLGARVWLSSVNLDSRPRAKTVCLTSPAVDCESLGDKQEFNSAASLSGSLLVCYSQHDPVLQKAFRWFGSLDTKHLLGAEALGFCGPVPRGDVPENVQTLDATQYISSHSAWKECGAFYNQWSKLLKGQ